MVELLEESAGRGAVVVVLDDLEVGERYGVEDHVALLDEAAAHLASLHVAGEQVVDRLVELERASREHLDIDEAATQVPDEAAEGVDRQLLGVARRQAERVLFAEKGLRELVGPLELAGAVVRLEVLGLGEQAQHLVAAEHLVAGRERLLDHALQLDDAARLLAQRTTIVQDVRRRVLSERGAQLGAVAVVVKLAHVHRADARVHESQAFTIIRFMFSEMFAILRDKKSRVYRKSDDSAWRPGCWRRR